MFSRVRSSTDDSAQGKLDREAVEAVARYADAGQEATSMFTSTGDHPRTTVEGLETNTLADGLFHAATWLLAVTGSVMLWDVIRRDDVRDHGRSLFGWTLAGWGIFNVVEYEYCTALSSDLRKWCLGQR
jgi:hypothetical protein